MSENKNADEISGFIQTEKDIDPDLKGIDFEATSELSHQITELIKANNCNAILVIQGEDGAMCISEGNILPTKAMHVMQLICAGVFSGVADNDERHILDAVSQSLAKKLGAGDEVPKIIYN